MPPTAKPKLPSFAAELADFVSKTSAVPYEDLAATFFEAGWLTRLVETSAVPCYNGMTLVTMDLMVGRAIDALERVDQITMAMPAAPGPVSVAARVQARESVIFLLSGRLPPAAVKAHAAATAPQPRPNGAPPVPERTIDMTDQEDVVLPGEKARIFDDPPAVQRPNLIARREPDGVPIFVDLYPLGLPAFKTSADVVDAVLDEVATFLEDATTLEQITALGAKNSGEDGMISYVKDFGTEEQVTELYSMIAKRRNELDRPAGAQPRRRRVPAVPQAN